MARKSGKKGRTDTRTNDIDEIVRDVSAHDYNEDDGAINEDDTMLEMFNIIKEFQKRKATKTPNDSAAFQAKKNAIFTAARKNADVAVRDGTMYIEQYKAKMSELRAQEASQEQYLLDSPVLRENEDAVKALLDIFPSFFEGLSYQRAEAINLSSTMLEAHAVRRRRSRMKLVTQAKTHIDEDLENQRVATDATALIKHYKALLLS